MCTSVTPIEEIIDDIVENHKTGRWLSIYYNIGTTVKPELLGVKAFGKWVQRLEFRGLRGEVPGQKTKKAFREEVEKQIRSLTC